MCEAQEPNRGTCCELVLVLARSHLVSTARVGKKRASKDAGVRGKLTFDYCENEVLSQVILFFLFCFVLSVILCVYVI